MNKFYMNGKLIHKASDHNTKRCEVEKWVFLPHSDFERLKANPYQEHEAITAARDLMYEDKNAYHCIMLLDEYGEDGLLIEAEGFDYPRLSMFVPDAKSIFERYQTSEPELKLHDMIKDTVEKIAELAHTGKTDFTSADIKEEKYMGNMRTMAFQIPSELFDQIKDYLDRHHMTQKQFVLGLIQDELDRDYEEQQAMAEKQQAEDEPDEDEDEDLDEAEDEDLSEEDEESEDEDEDEDLDESEDPEESEDEGMSMEM